MKVLLPEQLRKLTDGQSEIELYETISIQGMISELESRYNGFKLRLLTVGGNVNPFVNIYVDGEDIRFLMGLDTIVSSNSEISIVPAVAGG